MGEVTVTTGEDHVSMVEMRRPPDNYFDASLIHEVADAILDLEVDGRCRAIVLAAEGKHFCAGAKLTDGDGPVDPRAGGLYDAAVRMVSGSKPLVAAVQGAAIGGGLGVAMVADFRVASPESRFAANFTRLGFFPGFGLTVTLPAVVGQQRALDLLYTGRRIGGDEALVMGLCDRIVPNNDIRREACAFAADIAASSPLAVPALRQMMRGDLARRIREATGRESAVQGRLLDTQDFDEGVRAMAERRRPSFSGR
jgi:2-(1,2-epoxy-1,2-dihydrophenyl)acetyl-CoA isomerase